MKPKHYFGLLAAVLLQFALLATAQAVTLDAFASYNMPGSPNGTSFFGNASDCESDEPAGCGVDSGYVASASVSALETYAPQTTTADVLSSASASRTDLRATATLQLNAFDPTIEGQGFFVDTLARLFDNYTADAGTDLFASPVFRITGNLQSTSPDVGAQISFFSPQLGGSLFSQQGTPVLTSIDRVIAPGPIVLSASSPNPLDIRLSANIETFGTSSLAGDYTAIVDFGGTVSLLGFALFEDAGMTRPILGGVTVSGSSGNIIPVIAMPDMSVVPLPAAAWLFLTALAGLLGFARSQR